jgi:hypothetical protein
VRQQRQWSNALREGNSTDTKIAVEVDGVAACPSSMPFYPCSGIEYSGIEPGNPIAVGGGYQLNFRVPESLGSELGLYGGLMAFYVAIGGSDSYNSEATVHFGSNVYNDAALPQARTRPPIAHPPGANSRHPESPRLRSLHQPDARSVETAP